MLSKNVLHALKKSFTIKEYPTADRNAHFFRIISQGLPYYFLNNGFSFTPLSVFIHVNSRCNLKCKMCDVGQDVPESMFYQNLKGDSKGDMPIDSFKRIIDKIKHLKPFIGIPVLEPLFYPYIVKAIKYVNEQKMRISIATNGTLLEDLAEDLVAAGLTKIIISVDGPQNVHDKIRGVEGTHQKVMKGIARLAQVKSALNRREPYIFINYVISEDNYSVLTKCLNSLPMEHIENVNFRVMFYCTEALAVQHNRIFGDKYKATSTCLYGGINLKNIDIDILYEQIIEVTKGYKRKCILFFNHGKEGLRTYFYNPETFLDGTRCVFPWYTMQVDHDGNVIAPQRCYHNIFGNILSQEFDQIWNGEKMRGFRKDLRKYGRFLACSRCEGVNF